MRTKRTIAAVLATLALQSAGCETPADDGTQIEAPDASGVTVVESHVRGDSVTFYFDRELAADKVDLAAARLLKAYVADDGSLAYRNLAHAAVLESDGLALRVFFSEPPVAGARYRAELGELSLGELRIARDADLSPSDDVLAQGRAKGETAAKLDVALPAAAPEWRDPAQFNIQSVNPPEGTLLKRNAGRLEDIDLDFEVRFGPSPIDCSRLPTRSGWQDGATDPSVIRLTVYRDGSSANQLMFAESEATRPSDQGYRGHVTCSESRNSLTFHLPGRLLGGASATLSVAAWSTYGYVMQGEFQYRVESPDILVEMTRLQNRRRDACEGVLNEHTGGRRCDVYVVTGSLNRDRSIDSDDVDASRHPHSGDFANMNKNAFADIAVTQRQVYAGPTGDSVDIQMIAYDSDGAGKLPTVVRVLGKVTSAVCAGFGPYCGKDAAKYGDEAHQIIAQAIEDAGEDDKLGSNELILRQSNSNVPGLYNWGLDGQGPEYDMDYGNALELYKGSGRGVKIWFRVREAEYSWQFIYLI